MGHHRLGGLVGGTTVPSVPAMPGAPFRGRVLSAAGGGEQRDTTVPRRPHRHHPRQLCHRRRDRYGYEPGRRRAGGAETGTAPVSVPAMPPAVSRPRAAYLILINAGAFLPISVGGLVGANLEIRHQHWWYPLQSRHVTASYWDTDTSAVVVGIGSDDADDSGAIDGTEPVQDGAIGKTTGELRTPRSYTDSGSNTEAIYAAWNLNLDNDLNTGDPTTGADDPWDFGTTSQYPVLKVDFNGDGSINASDINLQRSSPKPPSPSPPGPGPSPGGNGGSSGGSSRAPSPPPVPTRSPIIGSTPAATAKELAGDLLVLQRHDQPGVEIEVGVGWMSQDGQRIITIGFVRDGDLGQTYAVVRREGDGQVVRRWIAPDSHLVYAVPWDTVNTQYTFPGGGDLGDPAGRAIPVAEHADAALRRG